MSVFTFIPNRRSWRGLAMLCCLAALFSAEFVRAEAKARSIIVTAVPPHAFIVEQLAGPDAKVISLVDQGSDPHTYEPSPKQMLAISQASIYFVGGLEFERGLLRKIRSVNKKMTIVFLNPVAEEVGQHGHDDHDGHEDQHSWLSPVLLAHQVDTVFDTLCQTMPEQKGAVTLRYDHFKERIAKTRRQLEQILTPFRGRVFYVFHPAFGHFGEVYGLRQKAVEVGSKRPTARQIQRIIKQSKDDDVQVIFSQPQFDQRSAAVVADAIGGKIVVLDPLKKDVLANYLLIAAGLAASFQ